jgi:transposase-like protein
VREADACCQEGEIGALLRREGLYTSHLSAWRRQRDAGALSALGPKQRGRREKADKALIRKLAEAEAENRRLKRGLEEAELIIEYQKKTFEILGIPLRCRENGGSD